MALAVTVLPATDLYLMGRDATHNLPRGLTVAHKLVEDGVLCSVTGVSVTIASPGRYVSLFSCPTATWTVRRSMPLRCARH